MSKKIADFFRITWTKVVIILVILLILTPIISSFVYPSDVGGSASGSAYWQTKTFWGVYPFTLAAIQKTCDSSNVCENHFILYIFDASGIFSNGEQSSGGQLRDIGIGSVWVQTWGKSTNKTSLVTEFILDFVINLVICYLLACLIMLVYTSIKQNKQKVKAQIAN